MKCIWVLSGRKGDYAVTFSEVGHQLELKLSFMRANEISLLLERDSADYASFCIRRDQ